MMALAHWSAGVGEDLDGDGGDWESCSSSSSCPRSRTSLSAIQESPLRRQRNPWSTTLSIRPASQPTDSSCQRPTSTQIDWAERRGTNKPDDRGAQGLLDEIVNDAGEAPGTRGTTAGAGAPGNGHDPVGPSTAGFSQPVPCPPGVRGLFQSWCRGSQLLSSTSTLVRTFARSGRDQRVPLQLEPHLKRQDEAYGKKTAAIDHLPPPSLTETPPVPHAWPDVRMMDASNPSQSPNLADLLTSLSSNEDASRKMAAFKLQSLINDPSFAEHFVVSGGLPRLRALILESTGNTLAYSLASFARLLEVDQGWEAVNSRVVEKARERLYDA